MTSVSVTIRGISLLALAIICGVGSLVMFVVFPLGSLAFAHWAWSDPGLLCWDAGLSLVFFLQHSGMNRRGFRRWLARWISPSAHAAIYAIASGVALIVLVVCWQPVAATVASIRGTARLFEYAASLALFAVFVWSFAAIRGHDPLGIRPIVAQLRGTDDKGPRFMVRGPYRWVRHPLYSCAIGLLWTWPEITTDRLLFNILWTLWIVVGARLEERDLLHDFGSAYRAYQQRTPMLVPWRAPTPSSGPIEDPNPA